MREEPPKKKRGPKPTFEKTKGYARGAPRLATRVDPDVLEWVETRSEGTRPYIERLVREDREKTLEQDGHCAEDDNIGKTAQ